MRAENLMGIDLGLIQTFVTVAQERSFTKAAEALYLTQPVVSKRIAALEGILEMQLFIRGKSGIRLTLSGKKLFAAWSDVLPQLLQPMNDASVFYKGFLHQLNIAYRTPGFVRKAGAFYRRSHSDVELVYYPRTVLEMHEGLLSEKLDIAFCPIVDNSFCVPPLEYKVVQRLPLLACVHKSCPLARQETIRIEQLRQMDFLMISPLVTQGWQQLNLRVCSENGFSPRVERFVDDVLALGMNLTRSNQVFLTDENCCLRGRGLDIELIPVEGYYSGTIALWNRENSNPLIRDFLDSCEELERKFGKITIL